MQCENQVLGRRYDVVHVYVLMDLLLLLCVVKHTFTPQPPHTLFFYLFFSSLSTESQKLESIHAIDLEPSRRTHLGEDCSRTLVA
jgi:hypothetical protein